MAYQRLLIEIKSYLKVLSPDLRYHSYKHTEDVVKCVKKAIRRYKYTGKKAELLTIAAWAHDIGFVQTYQGHEEKGAEMVAEHMKKEGYTTTDINQVKKLIMVTKIGNVPKTEDEKLIKDADLDYLGRQDFYKISEYLFEEWVNRKIITRDRKLFNEKQIAFMSIHEYYTAYFIKNRTQEKLNRVEELRKKIKVK
jgi:uncharacterized protein